MTKATQNTITGPQYGASRDMPWNVMGKHLEPSSRTNVAKALTDAGLDYDVEVWDATAYRKDDDEPMALADFVPAAKSRAIVRPMPGDGGLKVVGMTGTRFTPMQNRDAFAIATDLCGDYGATIDGLADFRHGGASIMVLDLHRDITLTTPDGGTDPTRLNLVVKNSHDGNSALTFMLTPVRIPCTNVLPMATREAKMVWKISHTPNADERVGLARKSILEAVGAQEELTIAAQTMLDTEMVDAEFAKIVAGMWKVDPEATGKVADRKREIQDTVLNLYRTSPTLDGIRGTRWGGYNALTEYLDHFRPVKGDPAVSRAEGQIDGPNLRVKANLWKRFAVAVPA